MVDKKRIQALLSSSSDFSHDRGQRPDAIEDAYRRMETATDDGERVEALVDGLYGQRLLLPVRAHSRAEATCAVDDSFIVEPISHNRRALAAFSSLDDLTRAYPTARPKPLPIQHIALAALDRGGRILIDGTHIVPRPAVAALAQGDRWLPAWRDDKLCELLQSLVPHGVTILGIKAGEGGCDQLMLGVDTDISNPRDVVGEALSRVMECERLIVACDIVQAIPIPKAPDQPK